MRTSTGERYASWVLAHESKNLFLELEGNLIRREPMMNMIPSTDKDTVKVKDCIREVIMMMKKMTTLTMKKKMEAPSEM